VQLETQFRVRIWSRLWPPTVTGLGIESEVYSVPVTSQQMHRNAAAELTSTVPPVHDNSSMPIAHFYQLRGVGDHQLRAAAVAVPEPVPGPGHGPGVLQLNC
jgi:hypothetical protein